MLATAPEIGYDRAAEISKEAYKSGKTIREVALAETDLSEEELDKTFLVTGSVYLYSSTCNP